MQKEIWVTSSLDKTMQPSLFYKSESKEKRPLLVGLHTWSYDRFNQIENMLPYAKKYDFNLLLPEFRGPNTRNNEKPFFACGSEYAKRDIKDAIDYVIEEENADKDNVFLLGLSGGGHMALLMAGYCPSYFKAIGAYVPITDLKKWAEESESYKNDIYACCTENEQELLKRSPINYIDTIAKANLKIFHGKFDNVVPFSQSMELFSSLTQKYSDARVFLDIFDGGHEIDMKEAMYWILSQYEKKEKIKVTG